MLKLSARRLSRRRRLLLGVSANFGVVFKTITAHPVRVVETSAEDEIP